MHDNPFAFIAHSCHSKFVRMQQEKKLCNVPNCINIYTV
jgi:hypothetical protein